MADLNVLAVVGRLVRDPELKYNEAGRPICRATIANNVGFGKTASTNYIRTVTAGQAAEYLAKYGEKGRTVSINGELRLSSHKNDDGTYNNSCTVFVKDIAFIGNGYSGDKTSGEKKSAETEDSDFSDTVTKAYADAYNGNHTQDSNANNVEPKEDIPF